MEILWICDSLTKIKNPKETSLRLIEESLKMGYSNWFCTDRDIEFSNDQILVNVFLIKDIQLHKKVSISSTERQVKTISFFHYVFSRIDPPFPPSYISKLQLLLINKKNVKKTIFINTPETLLTINSKIACTYFKNISPKTLITASKKRLIEFISNNDKTLILKPLNGSSSKNVMLLSSPGNKKTKQNKIKMLTRLSLNYSYPVVIQEFVKDKTNLHEIRVWFAKGKVLSIGKKIPKRDNMILRPRNGVTISKHKISSIEKGVIKKICSFLKKEKISLAAVDILNGFIIDFNVSSPGLVIEFEESFKINLSRKLLNALIKRN
jgi:glutathione synthase